MHQYSFLMRLLITLKDSTECRKTLLDPLRSVLQSSAPQTLNMHADHLGNLVKVHVLIQQFWRWGPTCCISNLLPGDACAAGPWTALGVARFYTSFCPSTIHCSTPHVPFKKKKVSEADDRFERVV